MEMDEIYSEQFWRLFADLDVSLDPSGPDELYEFAAPYLTAGARVLDVGCRDARHLIELARRHAAVGVGIDPVAWHVQRARTAIDAAGLRDRLTVSLGRAEALPEESASIDLVWCRDVIEVLPDLAAVLSEMHRVLRPGGHLIAYTNLLNGPIDAAEDEAIHQPLGNVVANLVESGLEEQIAAAGFLIEDERVIGTRWREHIEERERSVSQDLLRLARLRRLRDRFTAAYGADRFAVAEASLQWSVQQFLGRFVPVVYTLVRR